MLELLDLPLPPLTWLFRRRRELILEKLLLRHQLHIRSVPGISLGDPLAAFPVNSSRALRSSSSQSPLSSVVAPLAPIFR